MLRRRIAAALRTQPRLFDAAKRASRSLGIQGDVYRFLVDFDARHPHCRFLQIGSCDGMKDDPLREFVVRGRWRGIFVEPVPHNFRRLRRNYGNRRGLHFVNAAVSSQPGTLTFYAIKEASLGLLHDAAAQVGSLDRAQVLRHFDNAEGHVEEIAVPVTTVGALLDGHGFDTIDLIHIDAEGHEPEIITSIDLAATKPHAIIYESRHLGVNAADVADTLHEAGYTIRDNGYDAIAHR